MKPSANPYVPMGKFSAARVESSRDLNGSWRRGGSSPESSPSPSPTSSSSPSPYPSPSPSPPPSSSPRDISGCWRSNAQPLPPSKPDLPDFDNDELVGMVLHLPQTPAPAGSRIHDTVQGQSPWNHPVVIVKKWKENGEEFVRFRMCTTFVGQHVREKKKEHEQIQFLLAANEEDEKPHGNTRLAKMEIGSGKFAKRTYVNLGTLSIYDIEYKNLEKFRYRPLMRFDSDARSRILAGCPPTSWA